MLTLFKLKNVKSLVIWMEDQAYTRSVAQGALTAAPFVGINLTRSFIVPANPSADQVDAIMDELVSLDPDAVVGGTYYASCQHFLRACTRRNWFPKALFMSLCSGDSRASLAYENGGLGSDGKWTLDYFEWDYRLHGGDYEDTVLFPPSDKPSPALFRDYFMRYFDGSEPTQFSAIPAGVGVLLHVLMNRTGLGVRNDLYPRLLSQTVVPSFIGKIGFNGWGQNSAREVVILQPNRNWTYELIYPVGIFFC